jgi:hypothetical protein
LLIDSPHAATLFRHNVIRARCKVVAWERPMRTRDNRHPALKHGAYATTAVHPGESRAAFDKLHRDLIAELAPSGEFEDDIVTTVARLIWRKQNLRTLRIAELVQTRCSDIRFEVAGIEDVDPTERVAEDRGRKELGDIYELEEIGEAATFDGLTKELDIKERLDTLIDRCLKRLLFLRGLKSISSAPSSASRVSGPSRAA